MLGLKLKLGFMSGSAMPALMLNFISTATLDPRITFSRGTNGMVTDATGKLTYAPNNLLMNSESFEAASWTKQNLTVASNATTAPDGTLTSDSLIETVAAGPHQAYAFATTTAVSAIFSVYIKANGRVWAGLGITDSGSTVRIGYFNLSTGSIGTMASGLTGAISDAGNGWYRCAITVGTAFTGSNPCRVYASTGDGVSSYTGDGTSGIYIWGAQLEAVTYQTTPGTYNATTSAAYYGPRFDYDPVTLAAKGLLIEEARTNLCVYSQTPSDANWSATSAAKTSTNNSDPFGTSTALLLTADGLSGTHYVSAGTVSGPSYTSGTTYTISCFVKAGTTNLVQLTAAGATFGSVQYANFSLTGAGSVTASAVGTAVIVAYSGGWYRISLTVPATASAAASAGNLVFITSGTDGRVPTNTSSGTLYVAGWQAEAGSFATSYIPTAASSATRNADVATMTGANFSSWYNQNEGTFVVGADMFSANDTVNGKAIFAATDGTTSNRLYLNLNTSQIGFFFVNSGGVTQANITTTAAVANNVPVKFATAYLANDFAASKDGGTVGADVSGTLPTVDRFGIGHLNNFSQLNGHIRTIAYYNSRLPDTTLRSYST